MTWTETHRRWQAMRAVEEQLRTADRPELPWNDELALIFGDPDGLRAALRYRWRLTLDAQLDTHLPEKALEEQRRLLADRARGVLKVLDNTTGDELGTTHAVA
ncbi:hypothetical protein ACJ5H2_00475 [Nocardioides sp. R1-1]|uniref:hypothetical protein n=1 Tax=Nocardioides sp. R1-1 TaxID=3383502 RepID=UPI0038CFFCD7